MNEETNDLATHRVQALLRPASEMSSDVLGAVQCLAEMERHATAWHGLTGELLATNGAEPALTEPLPAWAVEILSRYVNGAWASYVGMFVLLRTYFECAAGLPPDAVYEIWTPAGVRLDGQFEFAEHAAHALATHRESHPDAFIMQMNVGAAVVGDVRSDHLLPTLVGEVRYLQTRINPGTGERLHVVRDSTGRAIAVSSEALLSSEAYQRMSQFARASVTAVPN